MKRVNELTNSPPPDPAPGSRGVSSFSPEVMSLLGNMVRLNPSSRAIIYVSYEHDGE